MLHKIAYSSLVITKTSYFKFMHYGCSYFTKCMQSYFQLFLDGIIQFNKMIIQASKKQELGYFTNL